MLGNVPSTALSKSAGSGACDGKLPVSTPSPFSHYIVVLDSRSKPLQARAFPHRCSTVDSAVLTLGMDSTAPADTQPNPVETKKQMLPVFDSSKKKRCSVPEEYQPEYSWTTGR